MFRILLEPQGGEGNGNEGNGTKGDLSTVAQGLLAKSGSDPTRVIMRLLKENYNYRQDINDLKGKVPGEGAVVLKGDEAKSWEKFKGLGDPKDVVKRLGDGDAAAKELDNIRTSKSLRDAAEAGGLKPGLFELLARQHGIKTAVEEAEVDGKAVRNAFVLGDGDSKVPLEKWVKANAGDLISDLKVSTERRAGMPPRPDDNPPAPRPGEGNDVSPDQREYFAQLATGRYKF